MVILLGFWNTSQVFPYFLTSPGKFQASGAPLVHFLIPLHPWPGWQFLKGFPRHCSCPSHCHMKNCCPIHWPESCGSWPIHHAAPQQLFCIPVTHSSFSELDQLRGFSMSPQFHCCFCFYCSYLGNEKGKMSPMGGKRDKRIHALLLFFKFLKFRLQFGDYWMQFLQFVGPRFERKLFLPKLHSGSHSSRAMPFSASTTGINLANRTNPSGGRSHCRSSVA